MAKIKSITVSKGRTVNIGNYNSVRIEYGVTADLEEKDKVEDKKEWLNEMVESWLEKEHAQWSKE